MADQLPLAQVASPPDLHDSMDESAWHALNNLPDDEQEHAGLLLKSPDGKFAYTTPLSSQQHDHFAFRAALQKGWTIAGVYHNHPGDDAVGQVFSPDDLSMATKLGVPSYIRFMKDGSIRRYTPGQTATQNMPGVGSHFDAKVAQGDPLPDDTLLRMKLQSLRASAAQQLSSLPPMPVTEPEAQPPTETPPQ